MRADCEECRRLWKEYGSATVAHIRLDGKRKVASLEGDLETVGQLTPEVERAARDRKRFREAISEHEVTAHEGKSAAEA